MDEVRLKPLIVKNFDNTPCHLSQSPVQHVLAWCILHCDSILTGVVKNRSSALRKRKVEDVKSPYPKDNRLLPG